MIEVVHTLGAYQIGRHRTKLVQKITTIGEVRDAQIKGEAMTLQIRSDQEVLKPGRCEG